MKTQIIYFLKSGLGIKEIARRLNCAQSTVSYHAKKFKLRNNPTPPKYNWEEIVKYYEEGHGCRECMKQFNFSSSAWQYAIDNGIIKVRNYLERWKQGLESGSTANGEISKVVRNYILDKFNNMCSKCEWKEINQITKKVPVQIEHIDGNYSNNKEENLTVLCPNCHSLTSTFGNLNKGKGRKYRYKRTAGIEPALLDWQSSSQPI